MGEFATSIAIDRWYKAVLLLGATLAAFALFGEVKVLGTAQALRLGVAMALLGLCAWKGEGTKV